ncbi:MAG: TraR/DksA C4-type zinc finger protein [Allobranchiibius sp.]
MSHHEIDQLLGEKEASLVADLAELTKPIGEIGTISFGKRVGEGTAMATDRITAVSTQEQLLAMLASVRRARERVAEGTYGICEVCGEKIPAGRLEARPWAVRCIRHS